MRIGCLASFVLALVRAQNAESRAAAEPTIFWFDQPRKKKKSKEFSCSSTSLMASNNNDDRPNNFPHTGSTCGPPKAQFPLQKILLNPISSTPHQLHVTASATASSSSTSLSVLNVSQYDSVPMGYNPFDLNLPPPPETHHDSPSPALHDAEKVKECNLKSPKERKGTSLLQDESFEKEMETNNVAFALGNNPESAAESRERKEIKEVGEREARKSEIWFGALLDAVECAMEEYGGKPSEGSKGEERNESNGKKKQRVKWKTGEEEEDEEVKKMVLAVAAAEEVSTSPVVKSNRGRTQVLPCKYRDSVIEPLTHLSSRHSRSSSTFGPTKRRSR